MDDYVYGEMSDGRKKWENRVPGGKNPGDKCGAASLGVSDDDVDDKTLGLK